MGDKSCFIRECESVRNYGCLCNIRVLCEQRLFVHAAGGLVHCIRSALSGSASGLYGGGGSCLNSPLPVPRGKGSRAYDKGCHEMRNTSLTFKEAECWLLNLYLSTPLSF